MYPDHSSVQLTVDRYIDARQIPDQDVTDVPDESDDNPNPNNFRIVG